MTGSRIQSITLEPVTYPLKKPFITAAGRKTKTDNILIAIHLANGLVGKAEASSSIAMASESQAHMMEALAAIVPDLRGQDVRQYKALALRIWKSSTFHPTAAAAMECALLDGVARVQKKSLARFLGTKNVTVETDLTFSVIAPADLTGQARVAVQQGFRRFKVKLRGDPDEDLARLQAVHRVAPEAWMVADGNQGFSFANAVRLAHDIEKLQLPVFFLEQPFARLDLKSMRQLREKTKIPVFADEAVLGPADAVKVFEADAADGVNVKLAKSGLLGALDILTIARQFKKRLAIGCMEESKLGLAASVHLACGTGVFEWVDLDSLFLLDIPPARGGFTIRGPRYSVTGVRSGIGM